MATPRATTRREPITFVVRTNSDTIANIDRDFGDGTTRKTTSNVIEHTYQTVGTYTVKAKVTTRGDDTNTALLDVFVGEKDSPIGIYKVVDRLQNVMRQREECEDPTNTGTFYPAYRVDRFAEVRIDMSESINIKGQKNN
jgi:PKD repeat protein